MSVADLLALLVEYRNYCEHISMSEDMMYERQDSLAGFTEWLEERQ